MEKGVNFVSDIEPGYTSSEDGSVFTSLFDEYERVVFRSIITSFGLDRFITDQHGGDVDTIHNVRNIGSDNQMTYKSEINAAQYENRGEYSHKNVEGTNYQKITHEARKKFDEDPRNNTVQDAYEDKPLGFFRRSKERPTDKNANLDHVLAAKTIHDDRGRVLAGMSTADLADAEDNLRWTNEHLNKSMGATEIPEYIASHPELPEHVKTRMMDEYNQAKASYERKISKAYYFDLNNPQCKAFYWNTTKAALQRGVEMGLRQAIGLIISELWFSIKDEWKTCEANIKGAFGAINEGVRKWAVSVKENYKEIIEKLGEGMISGLLSSLTTTLSNVFITTGKNLIRIIRQAWASVVEAISVLFFDSKEKYFCDRMTKAAKVLATGASIIVGTAVQQMLHDQLIKTGTDGKMVEIISTFAGSLCTGLLTVSLLFYIDNDPFARFLNGFSRMNLEILKKQEKMFKDFCASLEGIDIERFNFETEYVHQLMLDIDSVENNAQMNSMLKKAAKDLGLPSLWGEGSLADKLSQDPNWRLDF